MNKCKRCGDAKAPSAGCKRCGECCKFVVLDIQDMGEDERLWLSYHKGMTIYEDKLIILNPCRHLKRVNRQYVCDIHDTDKYPEMCRAAECMKEDLEAGTLHRFVQDLRAKRAHEGSGSLVRKENRRNGKQYR